jgi:hypothetical protein
MKNIWNKIKNYWSKLRNGFWPFVLKHDKCLYTFLITTLVFLSIIAYQSHDRTKHHLQWKKERALLVQDLKIATEIITIQGEIIRKKEEVISVQRQTLERAKGIILMQNEAIKDLIKRFMPPPKSDSRNWATHNEAY